MQVLATLVLHSFTVAYDCRLKLIINEVWQPTVLIRKGTSQEGFHCWLSCIHLITLTLSRHDQKETLTPHESLVRVFVVFEVVAIRHSPGRSFAADSLPFILFFVTADNVSVAALFTFRCFWHHCIVILSQRRRQSRLISPLFFGCAWIHIFFHINRSNYQPKFFTPPIHSFSAKHQTTFTTSFIFAGRKHCLPSLQDILPQISICSQEPCQAASFSDCSHYSNSHPPTLGWNS